jgi:hypothetical protein
MGLNCTDLPQVSVTLCDFQNANTVGFIVGMTLALVLVIQMVFVMWTKGGEKNDQFKYYPGTRFPRVLLAFRFAVVVFCMVTLGYTFNGDDSVWALSYFTVWNWLVVCMYFVVSLMVSIVRVFYPHLVPSITKYGSFGPSEGERSTFVKVLFTTQQILGELEVPCSVLVFIIVWAYLAPTLGFSSFLVFTSVAQHIFNAIFMVTDFCFAGYRFNGRHFVISLGFGGMYVVWHLLGNLAYGVMAYPFMATDDPIFIGWVCGLAILMALMFFMFYGLSVLKTNHRNKRFFKVEAEEIKGEVSDEKTIEEASPETVELDVV